jgi:hypothetical protein
LIGSDEGMSEERHRDRGDPRGEDRDDDFEQRDRRLTEAARKKTLEEALDSGLEDTFPGSDPVAVTQPPRSPFDKDGV